MTEVKTFPCPGCAEPLLEGTVDVVPFIGVDGISMLTFRAEQFIDLREHMVSPGAEAPVRFKHYPMSITCLVRGVLAALRSIDEGKRNAAQIVASRNEAFDRRFDDFVARFTPALEALAPIRPAEDPDPTLARAGYGAACIHGKKLTEPCEVCDDTAGSITDVSPRCAAVVTDRECLGGSESAYCSLPRSHPGKHKTATGQEFE